MNFSKIRAYYERSDIKDAIISFAKNREVAGVFKNGEFTRRPNTLTYPKDITAMVRQGVVEFHCSLEHWKNPMALKQTNYDQLRRGWDLILDIDCEKFEHAKITARTVIRVLKNHDIKNISVKYTGGEGFHLGIPWKSFPDDVGMKSAAELYPDIARQICGYLKWKSGEPLEQAMLAVWDPKELAKSADKPLKDIYSKGNLNPWKLVELDPVLISPRHLFRMPYSINRKSQLVSLPIRPSEIGDFEKRMAEPDKIKADFNFMQEWEAGEAELLLLEAVEWHAKKSKKEVKRGRRRMKLHRPMSKKYFPPCIKKILSGLSDGKKRSVFVLINFLRNMKWGWESIESELMEWNQRNQPQLQKSYIKSQLRYAKRKEKSPPPPNCSNIAYYKNYNVCKPDKFCNNIKNPSTYPFRVLKTKPKNKGKFKTKKQN